MSGTSRRILLGTRANGSIKEYVHIDAMKPDHLTIETVQDCQSIVDAAKEISEHTPGKDMRHVAKIPEFVLAQAMREGWLHDKKKWRDWANNPDNAAFRTWKGRL